MHFLFYMFLNVSLCQCLCCLSFSIDASCTTLLYLVLRYVSYFLSRGANGIKKKKSHSVVATREVSTDVCKGTLRSAVCLRDRCSDHARLSHFSLNTWPSKVIGKSNQILQTTTKLTLWFSSLAINFWNYPYLTHFSSPKLWKLNIPTKMSRLNYFRSR